jgi:TctA family transporter
MAYGSAVASNPNEKFGNGNIKGVIGPEGSNNAQKATSMVPTVLFGIPGAPFAAVLMGLLMYLGIELGTPDLILDTRFFYSMSFGFLAATVIVAVISLLCVNYICKITAVPYKYYFPLLLCIIVWSCMQYTGGWEDFVILLLFSLLGFLMKQYKYSRPAMLMAFILADKIENLTIQLTSLYTLETLISRPIFVGIIIAVIGIFIYSVKRKNGVNYG